MSTATSIVDRWPPPVTIDCRQLTLTMSLTVDFFDVQVLLTNVMNTVSNLASIWLLERNISVQAYFGVPFQGISELRYFIVKNIYIINKNK